MSKRFFLLVAAALAALLTVACEPSDQGSPRPAAVTYDVPETTLPDSDGPTVDNFPDDAPQLNESESARFDSWDGTGDVPFGDGVNDGRFRDVTCSETDAAPNGYSGGVGCAYSDGTYAAQGIAYAHGAWTWGGMVTLSTPGQCVDEDSCRIAWDHATTSPTVYPSPDVYRSAR
jgi:hypothetical protein